VKIVVLGGYGEIGSCISADLAQTAKDMEIVVAGRDEAKAETLVRTLKAKNVRSAVADARDMESVERVLKGADVVINATNYYMNIDIMKIALDCNVNYMDLGGLFHTTLEQFKLHDQFRKKELLAFLGCGSTPGITNLLALHGANQLDRVEAIHIQFGDKDYTKYNTPFVVPYSMHTVFDEFSKKPAVFENGKTKFVEPLSGDIKVLFPDPVGVVTCRYSLHSEVATLPVSFKSKGIRGCTFRGGWDNDFIYKTKFLIDSGFSSYEPIMVDGAKVNPRNVAVALLNRFIPGKDVKIDDLEYLRIAVTGKKNGKKLTIAEYCKAVTNKKLNIPSGTWDTGVPASIIAQMIAKGEITSRGVLPPEKVNIDLNDFFSGLKRRNIEVFSSTE
jgi:saccharopine dehydrogenase-like NADP-dependent oxidoreductase